MDAVLKPWLPQRGRQLLLVAAAAMSQAAQCSTWRLAVQRHAGWSDLVNILSLNVFIIEYI